MKAKKCSAGNYEYSAGGFTVSVFQTDPNPAYGDTKPLWIAAALWRNDTYTDPLDTKRQAVVCARKMLNKALGKTEEDEE